MINISLLSLFCQNEGLPGSTCRLYRFPHPTPLPCPSRWPLVGILLDQGAGLCLIPMTRSIHTNGDDGICFLLRWEHFGAGFTNPTSQPLLLDLLKRQKAWHSHRSLGHCSRAVLGRPFRFANVQLREQRHSRLVPMQCCSASPPASSGPFPTGWRLGVSQLSVWCAPKQSQELTFSYE